MYCPNPACQAEHSKPELLMSERSGIEIDYCPRCRGIWLDRGELDKLLENAAREPNQSEPQRTPRRDSYPPQDAHYKPGYEKHKHSRYSKKSLLAELFDF